MNIEIVIREARNQGASDIHMAVGQPVRFRIHGKLVDSEMYLEEEQVRQMILSMLNEDQMRNVLSGVDADFALSIAGGFRQRVNVYKQQGKLAAVIRLLNASIPSMSQLKLPPVLKQMALEPRGLILVTGPTGSGKSTTLAAMIDEINHSREEHILTIEDPIEYVYTEDRATIHQREVGEDVTSFASALRSALREDPDVILVGEMRDYETISAAVTAAETGHLVMSTLHTTGAAQTIDRIIDACPGEAQNQIRTQLSAVLRGVVTQALIPTADGRGRVAATEILVGTDAVLNLIRENKCHQLGSVMQSGAAAGMHTLNGDLSRLANSGIITREMALKYSTNKKDLQQYLF